MKEIKLKMFGKRSVSTLFFYLTIMCIMLILIKTIEMIISPDSVWLYSDIGLFVLNIMPAIGYLGFLIPFALVLNAFKGKIFFTKNVVSALNLFGIVNLSVAILNSVFNVVFLEMEWSNSIFHIIPHIILALFSFFVATIFKQGFQLQQENDLTV